VEPNGIVRGHVLHVDRFGNLITDIRREVLTDTEHAQVEIGGRVINGIALTYAMAHKGALLALIGSAGHLEIAVREGDAAALLGATIGTQVVVKAQPSH
jgi:S-adenosylmethionine hydrolase